MILYTDKFNIGTLKVLIAKEISELSVDIQDVASQTKVTSFLKCYKLPVLKTDAGNFIFSPNSICRFLLETSGKFLSAPEQEKWIEWESTHLQTYLLHVLHSTYAFGKCDERVKVCLQECLAHLNKHLQESSFLASNGANVGLAEIVIWSTLYTLVHNKELSSAYLQDTEEIKKWFTKFSDNPVFQKGVSNVLKGKDVGVFKDSLLFFGSPRLPLVHRTTQLVDESDEITDEDIKTAHNIWISGKLPPLKPPEHPVLPKPGERNILISSALPYVNNVPHLGNIIGAVLSADVFARYCRLRQYNTFYVCGTDEYGTATETKAIEENTTPKEICDKYHKLHHEIYTWFDISFDFFGRTTTDQQTKIAQDIFWKLHKSGYILQDTVEQLFCDKCQRFLADRYVQGICPFCNYDDARGDQCDKCSRLINTTELKEPKCQVCSETPTLKSSEHLFLDLPKLETKVKDFLDKSIASGHWSTTAKVISYAWLKDGLKPRCISRDLKWGTPVPLPGFTNKVFYVWFDAPIGYLSMSAKYTEHWEKWWKNPENVQLYQFMAKDNVPFHSIVFPSSQLGSGDNFTTVNHLAAVEYLNYEDSKFSKSRGIGVFGNDAKDTGIPSDIWRFYLMYIRPESQDTVFSWNDLMTKNNSELLNNLGNFINRSLMFLYNNFGGVLQEMVLTHEDKFLIAQVAKELQNYIRTMENVRLRDGIRYILNISRYGNQHIQANKPWELIKGTAEQKTRAGCIMGLCANITCLLSVMLEPYMPKTSRIIQTQLNSSPVHHVLTTDFISCLPPGHQINKPSPLFKKIEQSQVDELKVRYAGKQNSPERTGNVVVALKENEKPLTNGDADHLKVLITEQGEKVRALKSAKADKKEIDVEVQKLLSLKKELALATGQDPSLPVGKPQNRKKQKK